MAKRFNAYISMEAHRIIEEYKEKNGFRNKDEALNDFILKHGT